jgi:hypothetical protein
LPDKTKSARDSIEAVPLLVSRLYALVAELESHFPERRFTPDGHLVGSLGEVIAAYRYNLKLLTASEEAHDAASPCGRRVQIKATQGKSVGLRAEPQHLLVLKLTTSGEAIEIYNGPGDRVWIGCGKMQRNGQRTIGLGKLRALMVQVPMTERLHACQEVPGPDTT